MKEENKLLCDNCKKILYDLTEEETKMNGCFCALCLECGLEQQGISKDKQKECIELIEEYIV